MTRYIALALLLIAPLLCADSIYRTTDKEGNVVFTDAPPADGSETEPVGLQPTNTSAPPPERSDLGAAENAAASAPESAPYAVTITSPADETTIPMGPGNFSVSVSIQPELDKYESLQLYLDGKPWGEPQASAIWDLTNVFRGAHDVTVGVLDRDRNTLATSAPVRVYVHRPSLNFRKRP